MFPFHLDADLCVAFTVLIRILRSVTHLRANTKPIPVKYQMEEVPVGSLSAAQSDNIGLYDEKLASINYWPVATYRFANYGTNLIRSYHNPSDTARCVVMMLELQVNVNGVKAVTHKKTIEFITRFTDGTLFVTRNMTLKSVLAPAPYRTVQECPNEYDPAVLKRRHDAKVSQNASILSPSATAQAIFTEIQAEHQRYCAHLVKEGSYALATSGTHFKCTDRVFWRGIRNHLNPFVNRPPLHKLAVAIFLGIALPVLGRTFAATIASSFAAGLPGVSQAGVALLGAQLILLGSYLAAGIVLGLCVENNGFIWSFIVTYLGVNLLVGFNHGLPYSSMAGVLSFYVTQFRKRRRLVLLPARA